VQPVGVKEDSLRDVVVTLVVAWEWEWAWAWVAVEVAISIQRSWAAGRVLLDRR